MIRMILFLQNFPAKFLDTLEKPVFSYTRKKNAHEKDLDFIKSFNSLRDSLLFLSKEDHTA